MKIIGVKFADGQYRSFTTGSSFSQFFNTVKNNDVEVVILGEYDEKNSIVWEKNFTDGTVDLAFSKRVKELK